MREFTKIFLQVFALEMPSAKQDYVLASLVEHAKKGGNESLYFKFDSAEACLKACQQIFRSQLARQFLEQRCAVSNRTLVANLTQFSEYES